MSKKTLLVLVLIIGVLAVCAFVFGLTDNLFDIDVSSFAKEYAIEGNSLGPNSVHCEAGCASKCRVRGREIIISMAHNDTCGIRVAASQTDTSARNASVMAVEGIAQLGDLQLDIQGSVMDMGRIQLKTGEEKKLQFFENGGHFSVTCLSSDGCKVHFPAKVKN